MKFIFTHEKKEHKPPTIDDVEMYQFFVCKGGYLYQKIPHNQFIYIANPEGEPEGGIEDCFGSDKIQRTLPHVDSIEF